MNTKRVTAVEKLTKAEIERILTKRIRELEAALAAKFPQAWNAEWKVRAENAEYRIDDLVDELAVKNLRHEEDVEQLRLAYSQHLDAVARAEKAEARVAELEAILDVATGNVSLAREREAD